jgi:acyl-[acyl-carrier-protein]-phospholipid O-acyltransferase/long-chain-fatty-acid--[acyl-carrier-protein] ligase
VKTSDRRSLPCLLVAQTQVAFNDNAAKFLLAGLAALTLSEKGATRITCLLAALLVIPFVLFAPLVGWLADRFPKQKILSIALLFQVVVMGLIILAVQLESLPFAIVGFALLAMQASLFSPAKYGIVKELVGSERLGVAMGWLEMLTVAAILLGGFGGGWAIDHLGSKWEAASQATLWLGAGSLIAWFVFLGVRQTEVQSVEPFQKSILWRHVTQLRELWLSRPLRLSALGVAYFYSFGGLLYLTLFQLGREMRAGGSGAGDAGVMLALLGFGVGLGSLAAAGFCRRRIELGLVPVGALGISLTLLVLGICGGDLEARVAGLIILGVFAGLFTVPLNAFLQDRAGENQRGRVTAATNLLTNLAGLVGVGIYFLLADFLNLSAHHQFLVLFLPTFAVALYIVWLLPESLLRLWLLIVSRCFYRVRAMGLENLPSKGGVLLVCNHVSYVDAIVLQLACPRPIRFVAYEALHHQWWLGWALRILGVIPISSRHAKDAVRSVAQRLKQGEVVCIFPEGQLTRTGVLMGLRKGFELMARQGEAPVVPVFLDALWGSIFSFSENRYFLKLPRQLPYPVSVDFGKPIAPDVATRMTVWKALLDLGEEAFEARPELQGHLGYASIQALSRQPWKNLVVDRFPHRRPLSRGMVLALAIALARRWRHSIKGRRVGVVLPPGIGGVVVNVALSIADKIPVNLNFTAGRAAVESCLRRAGIETIVSAGALRDRFTEFPWPSDTLDVAEELRACGKPSIIGWLAVIWLLPSRALAQVVGTPCQGDRQEAILFFTSGSSGDPKGVPLTHRNVLGNVAQIAGTGIMHHGDVMMACLPLFHSFGYTVTLWYAVLHGVRIVALPSPLEAKKIGEAVRDERVTILIGTPTFLRSYIRKVDAEQFRSLRFVIAGAEKLPSDVLAAFKEKFGMPIYEGYGLTETTPVVAVNREDPPLPTPTAELQLGHRPGSVGRLLPGITVRIGDPDTGQDRELTETGMLYLRGANIFNGYLADEERTREVLCEGWFRTGDLGRFDGDAFLFIEGRLSRFSKIGGEMVPHGTVEQKIIEALGLQSAETQPLVVTGVPDETKGEALVLLTTVDVSPEQLREKLTAAGLPNLWIPRTIRRVEKIPTLSTGKLDLKGCEKLAKE